MSRKNPHIHPPLPAPAAHITSCLLDWYDQVHTHRDMPWRKTTDPYAIWLSETMLQQTQVETVKPYFARFLARFPTIAALAAADLDHILSHWAGLGYYRRARNLHAAAQLIVEKHAGQLPDTLTELIELPGVGRYTAGAVASIAFNQPEPVVDGNVMRVLARLTGYEQNIADPKNAPFFWHAADELVRAVPVRSSRVSVSPRYGDLNQSLMELGATVCLPAPAQPSCLICPLHKFCKAFAEGRQAELPVKTKRGPTPEISGTALVLLRTSSRDAREVLLLKRPSDSLWAGMWEFPVITFRSKNQEAGSRKKPREEESAIQAKKWIHENLSASISSWRECGEVVHQLTHRRMRYKVYHCEVKVAAQKSKAALPECREGGRYVEARWISWPLTKDAKDHLAYSRVVERIAASCI